MYGNELNFKKQIITHIKNEFTKQTGCVFFVSSL